MIARAEQEPHRVGRDEPDEPHRAGADDGYRRDGCAGNEYQRPPCVDLQPNTTRAQLTGCQDVQWSRQHDGDRDRHERGDHADRGARRPAQIAREPEHHAPHA